MGMNCEIRTNIPLHPHHWVVISVQRNNPIQTYLRNSLRGLYFLLQFPSEPTFRTIDFKCSLFRVQSEMTWFMLISTRFYS